MTFQPFLPPIVLVVVAAALIAIRIVALRQVLTHTAVGRRRPMVLRWCGMTLAVLLLVFAAARPGIGTAGRGSDPTAGTAADLNVFLLVDRTADKAGITEDIGALIDAHPQARFGMITFALRPSLEWPLSDDAFSLRPVVESLTSGSATAADTASAPNAGAASNVLRYQLIAAAQQYPQSRNLVFYLGAGAPGSPAPQSSFELPPTSVDGGAVLGYGTAGAIDEPALRGIAEQLGVPYVQREDGQSVVEAVSPADTGGGDAADASVDTQAVGEPVELYWLLALVAAGLLLIEIFAMLREFRRHRVARRDVAL